MSQITQCKNYRQTLHSSSNDIQSCTSWTEPASMYHAERTHPDMTTALHQLHSHEFLALVVTTYQLQSHLVLRFLLAQSSRGADQLTDLIVDKANTLVEKISPRELVSSREK